MTNYRSRQRLPVWTLLVLVVASLVWQAWRVREEAPPPEQDRTDVAAPSQPAAPRPADPGPSAEPRRDLSADERRGGHTLARHVGWSDEQLSDRLDRERSISAASTYIDRATAERTVALALAQNASRVDAWVARTGSRPNLAIDYRGAPGVTVGRSLLRGRQSSAVCRDAVVVLRWDRDGDDYYVLTSYPELRR